MSILREEERASLFEILIMWLRSLFDITPGDNTILEIVKLNSFF